MSANDPIAINNLLAPRRQVPFMNAPRLIPWYEHLLPDPSGAGNTGGTLDGIVTLNSGYPFN